MAALALVLIVVGVWCGALALGGWIADWLYGSQPSDSKGVKLMHLPDPFDMTDDPEHCKGCGEPDYVRLNGRWHKVAGLLNDAGLCAGCQNKAEDRSGDTDVEIAPGFECDGPSDSDKAVL